MKKALTNFPKVVDEKLDSNYWPYDSESGEDEVFKM